jgi:hypothetical protein
MNDVWTRHWRSAVSVLSALAVVALAGPSVAMAATRAKPAQPGAQSKSPAAHGPANVKAGRGEGIVQSVSASAIVLRQLDGSTVSVSIGSSTQVFVDGKRASLRDVKAGYVASAAWKAGGSARVLQAFDLSARHAVRVGVVDSVSTGALVVTETGVTSGAGDATVTIPVNAKTRVLIDGKPAKLDAVKAGYTVVITANDSKGDKPAHELRFLRPV